MNKMILQLSAFLLIACGNASSGKVELADAENPEPAIAAMVVNDADWVDTDLGKYSYLVPVTVKLPKDAKLERNGNGGVDARLNDFYVITISAQAVSSIPELIKGAKSLTIGKTSRYKNISLLVDEPVGFVYTYQMNDEANGFAYQAQSHFFYAFERDGMFYSFEDNQAGINVPGSAYTEQLARNAYKIIKSSAK
ncbi:MAG TPA: hypothetical protein VGB50_10225 [Flavobacterium sp.]|jgi:hypothetical protein